MKKNRVHPPAFIFRMHCVAAAALCILFTAALPARAEIKVIETDSTYSLGDNDSKVTARRIATQEAERKALDEAGTFVASLTEVKEDQLTKDEVTAYTAGIVAADVVASEDRGTAAHPEVYVRVKCSIDTSVLLQQIDRYREDEELRQQVEDMARKQAALEQERDGLVKQLAAEKDKEKAAATNQKLDAVLTDEESVDTTNRVWAKVAPQIDFYGSGDANRQVRLGDMEDSAGKLEAVVQASPENDQARFLLAALYEQKNDLPRAELLLRQAIERHPANLLLHLRIGIVLREERRYGDALREFRVIEQRRPNLPQMLFQTGLAYKGNGNCRLASAYMKRFLLYTRRVDRPRIEKMKPKARAAVEACGGQAPRRRARRMR